MILIPSLFVVVTASSASAVNRKFELRWTATTGAPGAIVSARSAAVDSVGASTVAGKLVGTARFGTGPTTVMLSSAGPADAYVERLDPSGQLSWVRRISATGAQTAVNRVVGDGAGGAFVAGVLDGAATFDTTGGTIAVAASVGGLQGFVAHYDGTGAAGWVSAFGASGTAGVLGLAARPDGGVAVTGTFSGSVPLGADTLSSVAAELFVAAFDASGAPLWARQAIGTTQDAGTAVAVDGTGAVYVAGGFRGSVQLGSAPINLTTTATAAPLLASYDAAGTLRWAVAPTSTSSALATGLAVDASATTLAATGTYAKALTWGSTTFTARGMNDVFAGTLDPATGTMRWAVTAGGTGNDAANDVALDPGGAVLVAGTFSGWARFGPTGNLVLNGLVNSGFAARYGATGSIEWARSIAGVGAADAAAISFAPPDGLVVAGSYTSTVTLDADVGAVALTAQGKQDAYVGRYALHPNQPPVASNASVVTAPGRAIPVTLAATDPDGDRLVYSVDAPGPLHGTVTGTPPALTYTPASGFVGVDTFTFTARDFFGGSATATVTVTVDPANHAPVAHPGRVSTSPGRATPLVLWADDADGDPLTYAVVGSGPVNGVLSGTAPSLVYTPNSGYRGADSFDFVADDGRGGTSTATVSIVVKPPNVVVIMSDDQTLEQQRFLTKTNQLLGAAGTTFSDAVVSYSECCPSRATFLTGQYSHNHGVLSSATPTGGVGKLDATNTLAVWLHDNGYYTALDGKYLNGYGVTVPPTVVPPGWDDWYALADPTTYTYFNYQLSVNGAPEVHGGLASDYSTDVLARHARTVIDAHAGSTQPFFLDVTPTGPHVAPSRSAAIPSPKYFQKLNGTLGPRTPAVNEADVSDKPAWVQALPLISAAQQASLDNAYDRDAEALLSVDDAVATIVDALQRAGELDNTFIIFTSDNGYQFGEHRIVFGKSMPYEESDRVPLIIRGPGFPAGATVSQPVANVDLAPTIVALTGAAPRRTIDGTSLVPFTSSPTYSAGRSVLVENGALWGRRTYQGVRDSHYVYVVWSTGEKELYDRTTDPYQLQNVVKDPRYGLTLLSLDAQLHTLRGCAGPTCQVGVG